MRYLSWMAVIGMLGSPAFANPPCASCVPFRVVHHQRTIIRKIIKPVAVFVPSYVATIAPYAVAAPLYPAPAPGPTAAVAGQAALYSQQSNVQYGAVGLAQVQAQQGVQLQGAATSSVESELAAALREINQRLCVLEGRAPNPGPVVGPRVGLAPPKGVQIPKVFAKCAVCHTAGQLKGNEFAMFDKGKLIPFSERNLRLMGAKVSIGAMPPPGNKEGVAAATDEESQELSEWINKQ